MRRLVAEAAAIVGAAAAITAVIALPVLLAPTTRMFGMPIVGRHHDPFSVMAQFGGPFVWGPYTQPVTDLPGWLLTRLSGPVAAYNWLILLSFPLSAGAAYLLARHLKIPTVGATVAALAYAFSPFHLAQAAYHPHIAQTQWLPLYLLALWRCLDTGSPAAVAGLYLALAAVTLSNFYGGLIAAVITPCAVAAYWLAIRRLQPKPARPLLVTLTALATIAAAACGSAWYFADPLLNPAFAFPRVDLFRYSTTWWSYLVPPVAHPLLGDLAARLWTEAGVRQGLLEHQVSLGWGIASLAVVATAAYLARQRAHPSLSPVPVLILLAGVALVCSLSPERRIGPFTFVRPAALLYEMLPMFRAYGRFGVVVQLMAALLAGIAVEHLRRSGTLRARFVWVALLVLAVGEYAVVPSALSRDVLPTMAHRWVMEQAAPIRTLDCTPFSQESASVPWLTGDRVLLMDRAIDDCGEPNLPGKLAARGYTHLLVRHDSGAAAWFINRPVPQGLRAAGSFADAQVFAVTASSPTLHTAAVNGMFPREGDAEWSWRWMEREATWTVVNRLPYPVTTTLRLELAAFYQDRRLALRLNGVEVQQLQIAVARRAYDIGPLTVAPGTQQLTFEAVEPPRMAGDVLFDRDRRRLSFALGDWRWEEPGEEPDDRP